MEPQSTSADVVAMRINNDLMGQCAYLQGEVTRLQDRYFDLENRHKVLRAKLVVISAMLNDL